MGRRRRNESAEHRSVKRTIHFTPGEAKDILGAANEAGDTFSGYARKLMFSRSAEAFARLRRHPQAAALMNELRDSGDQLSRIGNNINQLAYQANVAGQIEDAEELQAALNEYQLVADLYRQALSRVVTL
jgi:hypothetical protein